MGNYEKKLEYVRHRKASVRAETKMSLAGKDDLRFQAEEASDADEESTSLVRRRTGPEW